jgi:AcrR family transcriptional regulator
MVNPGTGARARAATSRESILQAATEVFMESGLSGARVDEIARRAHANKAMIYYHFHSKQGLYHAALSRLFEDVRAEISRLRAGSLPPQEKLRAFYTRIAGHFREKRALPQIMLREILNGGKGMDARASRTLLTILSFVRETLKEGERSGQFREIDPFLFHITMLAPLMLHSAGASFRDRLLPGEKPAQGARASDAMLVHLLEALDRSLTRRQARPPVQRRQRIPK